MIEVELVKFASDLQSIAEFRTEKLSKQIYKRNEWFLYYQIKV